MAYVGYRIDADRERATPFAAGINYNEVFMRTFARIAPEVSAFGAPEMQVLHRDLSEKEASELEAICAKILDVKESQ